MPTIVQPNQNLGQLGGIYVADTANHTGGAWGTIQALSATVIASLTSGVGANGQPLLTGTLTAIPLPAGSSLNGYFTQFQLTSGNVVAYTVSLITV